MEEILSDILEILCMLILEDPCNALEDIPKERIISGFHSLKLFWHSLLKGHKEVWDERANHLAKLLVWFSRVEGPFQEIGKFLPSGISFTFHHFVDHWEHSPCLVGKWTDEVGEPAAFLDTNMQAGNATDLLKTLFSRAFTCPPFISDELDPFIVFREILNRLGPGFVLGDDIRILKSMPFQENASGSAAEVHFYDASFVSPDQPSTPFMVDIQSCIHAYDLGYTIALRGMEFRNPKIAAVADALAVLFGQATVGANLYVTPANAQGLTLHYDDHCVLVYQLTGQKYWKIYPADQPLPRLYSSRKIAKDIYKLEQYARKILLSEGDVLYIPRGYPHQAKTASVDRSSEIKDLQLVLGDGCQDQSMAKISEKVKFDAELAQTVNPIWQCKCMDQSQESLENIDERYSVHVTFGIEVESPFEWEGLIHISLHCWSRKQHWTKFFDQGNCTILSVVPAEHFGELCIGLLHFAIRDCGDKCNDFRKACLVASKFVQDNVGIGIDWEKSGAFEPRNCDVQLPNKNHSFEQIFDKLVFYVNNNADFQVACRNALELFNNSEDCLDWMRWFRHLSTVDEVTGKWYFWNESGALFKELLKQVLSEPLVCELEHGFTEVKLRFVNECIFLDACNAFESLLDRYRDIRRQFTSGMLALHY